MAQLDGFQENYHPVLAAGKARKKAALAGHIQHHTPNKVAVSKEIDDSQQLQTPIRPKSMLKSTPSKSKSPISSNTVERIARQRANDYIKQIRAQRGEDDGFTPPQKNKNGTSSKKLVRQPSLKKGDSMYSNKENPNMLVRSGTKTNFGALESSRGKENGEYDADAGNGDQEDFEYTIQFLHDKLRQAGKYLEAASKL